MNLSEYGEVYVELAGLEVLHLNFLNSLFQSVKNFHVGFYKIINLKENILTHL